MSDKTAILRVVTIDGPAGSGKGTLASQVAEALGWTILDSGALYRLVALSALRQSVDFEDSERLSQLAAHLDCQFISQRNDKDQNSPVCIYLDGDDVTQTIRQEKCSKGASIVAIIPSVRQALLQRQRNFAKGEGLIADGRDMGTVVFPDAPVKFFLTASAEERAKRRYKQLFDQGVSANLADLIQSIRERDDRDMNRAEAPLKPADDAVIIDSTALSIDAVLKLMLERIEGRLG